MALPNPLISTGNSSKLFPIVYDVGGVNTAAVVKAVRVTPVNGENMGHMGVATHAQGTAWAAGDPVVVVVGLDGTTLRPLLVNSSGGLTINGSVSITGTVTVATHAVTQSGTWNVGLSAGANNIGDVDILTIAAGTNTIGGTMDTGWDNLGRPPFQGFQIDQAGILELELLPLDASNFWNITTIFWSYYSGSTAPGAMRKLKFRYATGGTTFHTIYIPPTANVVSEGTITFRTPFRSGAVSQNINVILDAALGTGGLFSAGCTGYKTAN